MSPDESPSVATVEPPVTENKPVEEERSRTKRKPLPPHAVILHNDDINGCDFVVGVLQKVFRYDKTKAFKLMLEAHNTGRSAVWTGNLEAAELKADQIRSCGPDPVMKSRGAGSLKVTVEPLPQ